VKVKLIIFYINFRSEFIDGSISGTYSMESLQYYLMQHLLKIVHNGIMESVNGSNALALSRSDFDQGRKLFLMVMLH
jgi:hypothetical protein